MVILVFAEKRLASANYESLSGCVMQPHGSPRNVDSFHGQWQPFTVRNRFCKNWCIILSMIAMLGALVSFPLTATYAFAMSGETSMTAVDAHTMNKSAISDAMPCHKAAKYCPGCPQKICPDMGNCLVKYFQPLSSPIGEQRQSLNKPIGERIIPVESRVTVGSQIPLPLRPPIV